MKRRRFRLIQIIKRTIEFKIDFEVVENDKTQIRVVRYKYVSNPLTIYIFYYPIDNKSNVFVFSEFDCPLWILEKIVRKID